MPLTVTRDSPFYQTSGNQVKVAGRIDFDSSYPTGGETLNASDIGLAQIDDIEFTGRSGYVFSYTGALPATSVSVLVFAPTGGTAPTTIADPSLGATGAMTAGGADSTALTTHTHPGSAITGGRGVEMGNTTDLSTLTGVRFRAFGV